MAYSHILATTTERLRRRADVPAAALSIADETYEHGGARTGSPVDLWPNVAGKTPAEWLLHARKPSLIFGRLI